MFFKNIVPIQKATFIFTPEFIVGFSQSSQFFDASTLEYPVTRQQEFYGTEVKYMLCLRTMLHSHQRSVSLF